MYFVKIVKCLEFEKYILAVAAGISVSGAAASILIALLHCCRATRRATTGALALPIPLLPEDQIPLHAEPEHPVPMLSVQSAGCAGMERLGVPVRTSLSTPPDDRGHISRRMCVDSIQARDLLARDATLLNDRQIRNNNHLHHYHRVGCGSNSNSSSYSPCNSSNTRVGLDAATIVIAQQQQHHQTLSVKPINNDKHHHQLQQQQQIRCPHHVPLPDSEWGQDRDLQIRTRYQQSEITRSYIKPPPNKTVLDVPEQTFNFYSSTTLSTTASAGSSCNLRTNATNQHSNIYHPHQQSGATGNQHSAILTQQQQQQKSKPSVITKLFSRKSSPKSPTALSSSSSLSSNSSLSSSASSASSSSSSSSSPSSSSVSTSSSSSSLCSGQTHPISTAANLTATTCSLGAAAPIYSSLTPTSPNSSSFLTAIGATNAMRTSPSPPLVVTVPVASACPSNMLQQHQFHLQQQQQQQHLLLADSTNSSNLSSTSLHLTKSSSCNLSPACSSSPLSMMEASQATVAPIPSIDCCYMQATSSIQRSHSPSYNAHPSSSQQQQQSIDNCVNSNSSSSISSSNSMSSSRNNQHHI